ncbi:MAG TPA: class I SAM-dependent methyltransferase family protein [Candidatus Thermoplasmatota archaeon]|jgi:tRNA (guanine37-N1)-methyltransferase|nr:class I SAM-dependent methyltransferase family protein [Candidatus Thermoplasmatota archaeon]
MAEGLAVSLAVRVPRERGEEQRQRLRSLGLLRLDLRPLSEGPFLLLPVQDQARDALLGLEFTTASFAAQALPQRYQDLARVPEGLRALLPSSFDVVGDIVVVKLPLELEAHAAEVGRALLAAHKGARTVLLDRGVTGVERVRAVEVIAGEPSTVTEHVEHGARFRVDLASCYFSPRLATEHARVAALAEQGEVVLDLFAGVGPFAILIAKQGKAQRVYAVDLNPDAVQLIEENARLNKVQDKVRAVLADADAFAAQMEGQGDRVIMNLPHSADAHWEQALRACKERATIHYHKILDRTRVAEHVAELQARASQAGWDARLALQREVRLYSPSQSHVALDWVVRRKPTA